MANKDESESVSPAEREARVLLYWKAVELFSPQRVPRLNPTSRSEPVVRGDGESPLPWIEPTRFPLPEKGRRWRFTAYCGLYNLKRVRAQLEHHFGRDSASFDRRPDGESCLFAFQITSEGRPLLDTFVLASSPWAVGRLKNPGPQHASWLEGFEAAASGEALRFIERFAVRENDEIGIALNSRPGVHVGRPVQAADLDSEIAKIAASLGIATVLQPRHVRLAARQVPEKYECNSDSDDFLNSFFLHDLERLAGEARDSNLSPALSQFLSSDEAIHPADRIDVRTSVEALRQNTSPALIPPGRWPSSPDQPLYFSQQFAINSALRGFESKSRPIFGINGPPGTGKTTLLRDLIAAVIVERAKALARLKRPSDAFLGRRSNWRSGDYTRSINLWRSELLGHEIVVASSNNRAVENVTLEIPGKRSIGEEHLAEVDYFSDFASRILSEKDQRAETWALIAARLGSKRNRSKFINRLWFADKEAKEPRTRAQQGFLKYLQTLTPRPAIWEKSLTVFHRALDQEQRIRQERVAAWDIAETHRKLAEILAVTETEYRTAEARLTQVERQRNAAGLIHRRAKEPLREAWEACSNHRTLKPGLVDALFSRGAAYQEWRAKDLSFSRAVEDCEQSALIAANEFEASEARFSAVQEELVRLSADIAHRRSELAEQGRLLELQRMKLGTAFPDTDRRLEDSKTRELSSPWSDAVWNNARTRVLMAALQLHRTFIECVPDKIRANLHGAMDILGGKVPTGADSEGLQSAWATLFFLVPVVSTTFASFDRLFSHLRRESMGWLLIDEAGQAVPQAAAGALWRSKRAVIVGDPLQLEPIVSLPFTAQQALRKHFGVEETWLPSGTSVQALADRVGLYGTWLDSNEAEKSIWVGCPLRVHRRCEDPMFSISNEIAYSGQMVSATQQIDSSIPLSSWIDVSTSESDDHWIPAEGVVLQILLSELFRSGTKAEEILLISPFRVVARHLKEIARRHGIQQAGTIHVSQGRESKIVILVLGGNPRLQGAKVWASEKPNLLNVAVSRARHRLFIIGNLEEWRQYPNFSDAAAALSRWGALHAKRVATVH